MTSDANEAGKLYIANVKITEAVAFDPDHDDPDKPDSWKLISAGDFDPIEHKKFIFYCSCCLDKGDKVRLRKPTTNEKDIRSILFDLIDPETKKPSLGEDGKSMSENRRYLFPQHFLTWSGETHGCGIVKHQQRLSKSLWDSDAITIDKESDVKIINLNIPAGLEPINKVEGPNADIEAEHYFNTAAPAVRYRIHVPENRPPHRYSRGVKSVQGLAELIDNTQFDIGKRASIILRNGNQRPPLSSIYHETAKGLYKDLYSSEREIFGDLNANHKHIALLRFRPKGYSFWKKELDGSVSIPSQYEKVTDNKRNKFNVSTRINFQPEAFKVFKKEYEAVNKKDREFLVYTEHASVNISAHTRKINELQKGNKKTSTVAYTEAKVFSEKQVMQWVPKLPKQLTICPLPSPEIKHRDPTAAPQIS